LGAPFGPGFSLQVLATLKKRDCGLFLPVQSGGRYNPWRSNLHFKRVHFHYILTVQFS
jgi:hypothetical protein